MCPEGQFPTVAASDGRVCRPYSFVSALNLIRNSMPRQNVGGLVLAQSPLLIVGELLVCDCLRATGHG